MRLELSAKRRQTGLPREGLVHAVAKHHNIRRPLRQQRLQVLDIPLGAEPVADFIAGPREAAHAKLLVRVGKLQMRLQAARLQQPLDHPAAVEQK